jgi:hypothetical protein
MKKFIAKSLAERIGIDGSVLNHQPKGFDKIKIESLADAQRGIADSG